MSDQTLVTLPLAVILEGRSAESQALIQDAFGNRGGLPFGRKQESEADHIGLILMGQGRL